MPLDQIQTFNDIEAAWRRAERESDKRAMWRMLARGGWLTACREAVHRNDRTTLETWLEARDSLMQDILQFAEAETAQIVRTYLRCSLAVCRAQEDAPRQLLAAAPELVAVSMPVGFCRDLMLALVGEPLRTAIQSLSLAVFLVDTARSEGVGATLTLELLGDGRRECYSVPELAFMRDADFRQAEENARFCIEGMGLWRQEWDVRWRLHRRDGKPLLTLAGPSLGAAFALGFAKLFA